MPEHIPDDYYPKIHSDTRVNKARIFYELFALNHQAAWEYLQSNDHKIIYDEEPSKFSIQFL